MNNTILPNELGKALDRAPAGCKVLSLDCFDTLLWRHAHAPRDVFADIGPMGGTLHQRRWAESHARSRAALKRKSNEAAIGEIYEMLMPNASADDRGFAVAAELDAEARHCFAFAPTVALMEEAKRRGLAVMIVSDTYLDEDQLRALISAAAGEDVACLVDEIHCSSRYGVAKAEGLFRHVLRKTGHRAETILHVGDNRTADLAAPTKLGIPALHLVQFADSTQQRLRLEAAVGAMLNASGRRQPHWQAHRAQIACGEPGLGQAAVLGHSVLGPVFTAFDDWLREEAAALAAASNGRVHMLFLMRDGFLPMQVYNARGPLTGVTAAPVEISRFTAAASSFVSRASVEHFLEREGGVGDVEGMARQLLFDADEVRKFANRAKVQGGAASFLADVSRSSNVKKIIARSEQFARRLVRHVQKAVDPQPGDTLMLIDLGYHGSVQSSIEPILCEALNVKIAGRYLLLREQDMSGYDKRGLIDARHYDESMLDALCGNVAVVEQLSTVAQGSVTAYAEDGTPIRSENGIKARQSAVRADVQEGCTRFARDHGKGIHRSPASDCPATRRQAAAAALGRFLFLPMPSEIAVLSAFEHDVNLGGGETMPLFDLELAEQQLREQGMYYVKNAARMYLPAELRQHGFALSLSLLCQRIFGLELRQSDFQQADLGIPVIVADGREVSTATIDASRTHDGFFTAVIPVGISQYAVGLQFGRLFNWVELQSAVFQPMALMVDDARGKAGRPIPATPSLEGMEAMSETLIRCTDPAGFVMIPPPSDRSKESMVLKVVFRPIGWRATAGPDTSDDDHPEVVSAAAADLGPTLG